MATCGLAAVGVNGARRIVGESKFSEGSPLRCVAREESCWADEFDGSSLSEPVLGGVCLVRVPTAAGEAWVDRMLASGVELVDDAEQARAEKFVHARDAAQHRIGRAVVRATLSVVDEVRCDDVDIATEDGGRPVAPGHSLAFNLAHDTEWVVVAFASTNDVGVDVEPSDRRVSASRSDELVDDILTDAERKWLDRYVEADDDGSREQRRSEAMMHLWTVKEAVIKAVGAGLRIDPLEIECAIGAETDGVAGAAGIEVMETRVSTDRADRLAAERWDIDSFAVDGRHLGAVARPGELSRMTCVSFRAWCDWIASRLA
jgi:phosphopantetheine--protein transferase-like protein